MNIDYEVLLKAIAAVGGLGLLMGLILALASIKLAVKGDERTEAITAMLPGYNCGACGHPGCAGLADAIVAGAGTENDCKPANADQKAKISSYRTEQGL